MSLAIRAGEPVWTDVGGRARGALSGARRPGHPVRVAGGAPARRRGRALRGAFAELHARRGVRRPGARVPLRRRSAGRPHARARAAVRGSAPDHRAAPRSWPRRASCSRLARSGRRACAGSPTSPSGGSPTGAGSSWSTRTASCATSPSPTSTPSRSSSPRSSASATRSTRRRTGVPNVIRTGRSELYPEISDEMLVEAARGRGAPAADARARARSVMIVPLAARGASSARSPSSRRVRGQLRRADLELAEDLARRAALAIDNSMLFRREHEAAVTLQRSLLPESLPEIEESSSPPATSRPRRARGRRRLVRGRPRTTTAPSRSTIGDVAGRGINAASVMGRVRPALRAYVADGPPPAEADRASRSADQGVRLARDDHRLPSRATTPRPGRRSTCAPAIRRRCSPPRRPVEELAGGGTAAARDPRRGRVRQHLIELPRAACSCSTPTA